MTEEHRTADAPEVDPIAVARRVASTVSQVRHVETAQPHDATAPALCFVCCVAGLVREVVDEALVDVRRDVAELAENLRETAARIQGIQPAAAAATVLVDLEARLRAFAGNERRRGGRPPIPSSVLRLLVALKYVGITTPHLAWVLYGIVDDANAEKRTREQLQRYERGATREDPRVREALARVFAPAGESEGGRKLRALLLEGDAERRKTHGLYRRGNEAGNAGQGGST